MGRLSFRRAVHAAIIISWVVMTSLLIYRQYGPASKEVLLSSSPLPQGIFGQRWMGIYYGEKKVGYTSRTFLKTPDGYSISEKMRMKLGIMGSPKDVEVASVARLGRDLGLDSFVLRLRADANMTLRGTVRGGNLHVSIETAGGTSEKDIPLKERPVVDPAIVPKIFREGLAPGKRYRMPVIDPSTLGREEITFEVSGREKITVMGRSVEATRIRGSAAGTTFSVWVTAQGEVVKEESPLGFVLVAESRDEAMKGLSAAPDLTHRTAVPFNLKLPADTRYLKVRLSGIDTRKLDIDGGRQRLSGQILEVRQEDMSKQAAGRRDGGEPQGTSPGDSLFIQSKDPAIVAAAKKIVGNETDRIRAARLICSWVYRNVRKEPSMTVPVAAEVLRTMSGDCNEHTALYVALARAAAIPSRVALGLVYEDGFFYYHAWPEIYAGRWIAVDPTLGQFPADAAHIRLITGDFDSQTRIAAVVGKIGIEGIGYR